MGPCLRRTYICLGIVITAILTISCDHSKPELDYTIYSCPAYTVYADSVIEGQWRAKVTGPATIVTDCSWSDTARRSDRLKVRFALDGRDNESAAGRMHMLHITPGDSSEILQFGRYAPADSLPPAAMTITRGTRYTVRLDMRPVLRALKTQGYYVTATRDTIYRHALRGVWLIGERYPLTDRASSLRSRPDLQLHDRGDSIWEVTLQLDNYGHKRYEGGSATADTTSSAPLEIITSRPLSQAVYTIAASRLADAERQLLEHRYVNRPSTAAISLAVDLSLAILDPEGSKILLRRCVEHGYVLQDGGSGGEWPFSADRLMWVSAAMKVYDVTGDRQWLREVYDISVRTLKTDLYVLLDRATGLLHGAMSQPHDGRRGFPSWFTPSDLFQSSSLGVNVAACTAVRAVNRMAGILGTELPELLRDVSADELADRINTRFWLPAQGYYSDFIYGTDCIIQSSASDNMSQALAVLGSIASPEMAISLMRRTPHWIYGTALRQPVTSLSDPTTMSNMVLPHVQALWNLAAARCSNAEALRAGLGSMLRNFAFGLGYCDTDASSGYPVPASTAPDRRLLRYAALMAMPVRLVAGLTPASRESSSVLKVSPTVITAIGGHLEIKGLRYNDALLDITVSGTGTLVRSMTIDGHPASTYEIPSDLTPGRHKVEVQLANNRFPDYTISIARPRQLPRAPEAVWTEKSQAVLPVPEDGICYYSVLNGVISEQLMQRDFSIHGCKDFTAVSFVAVDKDKTAGPMSAPHRIIPRGRLLRITAPVLGDTGTTLPVAPGHSARYLAMSPMRHLRLTTQVRVPAAGRYYLDAIYANGNGAADSQNRAMLRNVAVNGIAAGTLVFPAQGEGNWTTTALSNTIILNLRQGLNTITVEYVAPYDRNAAHSPGTALLQAIRLYR